MDGIGFAVIAGGVLVYGLVSQRLQDTVITAPMVFAAFGLLIGQSGLGLAELDFGHGFAHGLAEVTLILVLFSDAARIDLRKVRRDHNLPLRLLLVGMPLTIVAGTVVGVLLPLGLTFWQAALLAAILAPTDAALGLAVVANPHVPARVRQALNIESGLNDGVALPMVLLLACLADAASAADNDRVWLLFGAKQVVLGPMAGILIGAAGAWLMGRATALGWMAESYEGAALLGLALLAYAGAVNVGGNGFIAAFTAGLTFGNLLRERCRFVFEFAEAEGQILILLTFLIFGAVLVPEVASDFGPWVLLYAVLSLTVIRMLPVALSLLGSGVGAPTVAFLGWFGPRGLASILFALLVLETIDVPVAERVVAITIVTVALSILAHGLTAAPAARWYGAAARRMGDRAETKKVSEMPTRRGLVAAPDRS